MHGSDRDHRVDAGVLSHKGEEMILWYFSAIATVMFLGALVIRKRWLQLAASFVIWLMIADILLFYTGSVARAIANLSDFLCETGS